MSKTNKTKVGGKGTPKANAKTDERQPELNIAPETEATGGQSVHRLKTAETLAAQHGVDEKNVRRAGQFAAAVDKLGLGKEVATDQCRHEQQPTFVSQEQGGILRNLRPDFRLNCRALRKN